MSLREQYLAAVTRLLIKRGKFIDIGAYSEDEDPDDLMPWERPGDYDTHRITYSWADWSHVDPHYGDGCGVESVDAETMREHSFSQFQDTFHSNAVISGIEMKATCKCGKYTDRWLRWEGSMDEAMSIMLKEEE